MKEIPPPDPEQLLTLLNLQMEMQRKKRRASGRPRPIFLVAAIVFLLGVVMAAFFFLQQISQDLPRGRPPGKPSAGAR